jgi:hypothetical protein
VSRVVVLSWDQAGGSLEYVEVNGGAGGVAASVDVDEGSASGVTEALAGRELPLTAELVIEGDGVLIDDVGLSGVQRCRVTVVGRPGSRRFEFRPPGSHKAIADPSVADLGVPDDQANFAQKFIYLYAPDLRPPGCWLGCPGGIGTALAEQGRAADAAQKQREAKLEAERRRQELARKFINPYTFVPIAEQVRRCKPAGHHMLAEGRMSGMFTVTWTFTSAFQAPEGASGTTEVRVPGSSVKGAVRSVHEALAGGCLRIFDEDFIPSYRDTPKPRSADWTLAQVATTTKDGQPLTVRLCDDVVWVPAEKLRAACGGRGLATGTRVTISGGIPAEANALGRKELGEDGIVRPGGDWVVLVTSKGTRSVKKGTYFLACGRLGTDKVDVTEAAWRAFRRAVEGASDLSPAGRDRVELDSRDLRPADPVVFDSQRIGLRRVVTRHLWQDDVIWVRAARRGGRREAAEELSLSAVWRHPGWPADGGVPADPAKWAARERVPQEALACSDPCLLCPTCRIFGSADQNARGEGDRAAQQGYAGHVRFGVACSPKPVQLEKILRAPLSAPRPGAGQFYLAYADCGAAKDREDEPTREWGSAPDRADPRRLRGRKFYWHADPRKQDPPRHEAREHQKKAKMAEERWIAPAGTTLTQRVTFDGLSQAELGGLLAAFDPGLVLDADGMPVRMHLGGGKPLGLGSCAAVVSGLRGWSAASRYGGEPETALDPAACVSAFVDGCPDEVTGTWPYLAAVLAEGKVDATRVWYPPGAYWPDPSKPRHPGDEKVFDEPFAFFAASAGKFLATGPPQKLVPLPDPLSDDQTLAIVPKPDRKGGAA